MLLLIYCFEIIKINQEMILKTNEINFCRYVSPRGSPAQTISTTIATPTTTSMTTPSGYTSRFVENDYDIHDLGSNYNNFLNDDDDNNRLINENIKDEKSSSINSQESNITRFANLTNSSKNKSDGNSLIKHDVTLTLTEITNKLLSN